MGSQQCFCAPGVVTGHHGGVENLLKRVEPGFAAFQLNQIQDLILAFEQEIVKTKEDARSLPERHVLPAALRCSRAGYGEFHIVFIGGRKITEHFAGERHFDGNGCRFVRSRHQCGEMRRYFPTDLALDDDNELARWGESRPRPGGSARRRRVT